MQSISKQQAHIPYYFRSRLRPGHRSVSASQLTTSPIPLQTLLQNQLDLDIASHDLPTAHLRELREDLEINNILGRMVTFDVASRTWVDWDRYVFCLQISLLWLTNNLRPLRHFLNGTSRPVAASGLESYPDLVRPLCPHAANGFRMGCEMHVHRKTDHGKVTWGFQAAHDGCEFFGEFFELSYNLFLIDHTSDDPGHSPQPQPCIEGPL
jgi:hypothetical protein